MKTLHLVPAFGSLLGLSVVALACFAGEETPGDVLRETWARYVDGFVTAEGRVVDPKAGGITTSEGQAYAMLRAVWLGDRVIFDRTHAWAVENLNRGVRADHLWAWKWGQAEDGSFRVLDEAFASDADVDAALALLLAAKTWDNEGYLERARAMLADLWEQRTIVAAGRRFLLAGDRLCEGETCRINPSYYAPYAYRLFARFDPFHDWNELIDSSYFVLERNSELTATGLPSDWLLFDKSTGRLWLGSEKDAEYSYDAFRTHWRVALDNVLFDEPRARTYLRRSLAWLVERWRKDGTLPARISALGEPLADYEALEMIAALMPALQEVAPDVAESFHGHVQSVLADGLWGDRESYYVQNWAWFGTALYSREVAVFEELIRADR